MLLYCPYLGKGCFNIGTDHKALKWLLTSANSSGKLARWRLPLLRIDLEVAYRACVKQQALDSLSGLKAEGSDKTDLDEKLPLLIIDENEGQQDV